MGPVLSNMSEERSTGARILFLGSALAAGTIALWANNLSAQQTARLTPIFSYLFTVLDSTGADCALLILIAAVFVRHPHSFRPALRWIAAHPTWVAGMTFVVLCLGTLLVYRNYPLSMDEYCAYFQSQVFAAGHLTGRFPHALLDWLVPLPFQKSFLLVSHSSGRIVSAYWPSFALLLTPFTLLGIPWACNPAICALSVLVIHRLAWLLFATPEAAGLAVLLSVASPVFCADGISYYSMSAHLLANGVFALLLLEPTARRACLAGLVGSVALTLHNPVPHLLFAAPWIIWLATRPGGVKLTCWLIAGYLPLSVILGLGWFLYTATLTHEGLVHTANAAIQNGLVARIDSVFALPSQPLLLARTIGIAKIVVWAVPGMVMLACAGAWRWRHDAHCRLLALSAIVTLLGFLFVPVDQGHGWGFRYFHSAWLVLPLLAAGAVTRAPQGTGQAHSVFEDSGTLTFIVACALLTLVCGNAWRAYQIRDFVTLNLKQVPPHEGAGRRVVLIDPHFSFYGLDTIRNDPWLRGDVIRMVSHGRAEDATEMHEFYPELHRVYDDPYGTVWSATTLASGAAHYSAGVPR